MDCKFFDVNIWIGKPMNDEKNISVTVEETMEKMSFLNIEKAIVWDISQRDVHPQIGNEKLIKEISNKEQFYGVLTLLPFQTDEIKIYSFKELKEKKIVGFNFFPKKHNFILSKISFGEFLAELENRKFPIFLDVMSGFSVDYRDVYSILSDFPKLTCILCNTGMWNTDRFTWPLLEKFPNVYLESSLLSLNEGSLEETVKKFGAERIVFGSGFPERYFESSIAQLTHAKISKGDKV
ncbi:MAG: amidohydrolase [bacterium]|nr:amidohydrolase [bacterium]